MKQMIIPIFVPHQGCPHACTFCNQKKITGQEDRVSSKELIETIERFLKTARKRKIEIAFYGGSFTGIPREEQEILLRIANQYLKRGLIEGIRLSTRPDYIDADILKFLKGYGVSTIELGAQSLNNEVLAAANRGHTKEDIWKASQLIQNSGIKLGIQLMVGLPKDDFEKDIETVKEVIKISPDFVRIYPTVVIRGTLLALQYYRGEYKPLDLEQAVYICANMFLLLYKAEMKVIRMGLQTTETIREGGEIIAGPFHPSFRELVESLIYKNLLHFLLKEVVNKKYMTIKFEVRKEDLSKALGNKKGNFLWLQEKLNNQNLIFSGVDFLPEKTIRLVLNNGENNHFQYGWKDLQKVEKGL
jgi:radical SAM enzyme (TIGR01210 family)